MEHGGSLDGLAIWIELGFAEPRCSELEGLRIILRQEYI